MNGLFVKGIFIPESELQERFIRSSGPGGQNVNKVASAVQLRFNVRQSPSLSDSVRTALLQASSGSRSAETTSAQPRTSQRRERRS